MASGNRCQIEECLSAIRDTMKIAPARGNQMSGLTLNRLAGAFVDEFTKEAHASNRGR
jgi:hypothetical protein